MEISPQPNINTSRPRFMVCNNCDTTHVINERVDDSNSTCSKCGSTNFSSSLKGVPGHKPQYCDTRLDISIWEGVMAIILGPITDWKTRMEEKHNIVFSKGDIRDLATSFTVVGKIMVNWTREGFVQDSFVKTCKTIYYSYIYLKRRKVQNKTKYKA